MSGHHPVAMLRDITEAVAEVAARLLGPPEPHAIPGTAGDDTTEGN